MYIFNIFCLYSYLNLKITLETYGKKKLILESKEMMKKKILLLIAKIQIINIKFFMQLVKIIPIKSKDILVILMML